MAEIKDKPKDLPSTNALDNIEDPDAAHTGSQNIMLGSAVLLAMDPPPRTGDYIDVAMRLRIKRTAEDQPTPDSPLTYPRYTEIVVAWPLGQPMPEPKKSKAETDAEEAAKAAENQPPMIDENGEAAWDEGYPEPNGDGDADAPANPEFSSATS